MDGNKAHDILSFLPKREHKFCLVRDINDVFAFPLEMSDDVHLFLYFEFIFFFLSLSKDAVMCMECKFCDFL